MCYEFRHILKRKHHLVKFLDKAVTALDVLLPNVHAIYDGIARLTANLSIEEEVDVGVLEMIVVDEVLNKMHHWGGSHVLHKDDI